MTARIVGTDARGLPRVRVPAVMRRLRRPARRTNPEAIVRMYRAGVTPTVIAVWFGLARSTVYAWLREAGIRSETQRVYNSAQLAKRQRQP